MVDKAEKHIHFQTDENDYFQNYLNLKLNQAGISKETQETLQACQKLYEEARTKFSRSSSQVNLDDKTPVPVPRAFETEIKSQAIKKIANLHYFYHFFQNSKNRNDFKDYFDREHPNLHLESYPDFDVFAEFFENTYSKNDVKEKFSELLQSSHDKLVHYITGSQTIAIRQTSYHHIQKTIEKIVASDFFKDNAPQKVQYTLVKKNTAKLMNAKVDVPFGNVKETKEASQNHESKPKKQEREKEKERERYNEESDTREVKFSNVDADGFITVQAKKKPVKERNDDDKRGSYRNKDHKNKKYNNEDGEYRGSKGQKMYEKKIYTKKENLDRD